MGLGNIISQAIIEKKSLGNLDWPRVARFASFGYLFAVDIFSSLISSALSLILPGAISSILVLWTRTLFSCRKIKTIEDDAN